VKPRRNQPCPCGSGKKYKRCHGNPVQPARAITPEERALYAQRMAAHERIRQTQQGLGRPIISFRLKDHQMVAVGNTVYHSAQWKTFPDFLCHYIKVKLTAEWGNAEIAKPLAERHPIMQWYDAFCRYQAATIPIPGEPAEAETTGVVACYLGLAYSLYLMDHNVELQDRLIRRLKDPGNFQGAYYETIIANVLVRAGFELTLEEETDPSRKHCEFAAVSKLTRRKYWVEAKMRAVAGLLGRTDSDGGSDTDPLSRLGRLVSRALAKPAADERLIFIDINAAGDDQSGGEPAWHPRAVARLERYEREQLPAGASAYVFVTNLPFHRMLDRRPTIAVAPVGLGIPDFNKTGEFTLVELYRRKQKHIDAINIAESFTHLLKFPTTFDGTLPSEAFGRARNRVQIGQTYEFEFQGGETLIGTVTTASVSETEKKTYIGVTDKVRGTSQILSAPMSDEELAEYRAHSDAYFGEIRQPSRTITDNFEMFEWLMNTQKNMPRENILRQMEGSPRYEEFKAMSTDDLLAAYCEALVWSMANRKTRQEKSE